MSIAQVREALRRHGPLTAEQLGQYIDLGKSCISAQTLNLREKKQVFIIGYQPRANGTQGRNAPIYALGNAPDAVDLPRGRRARAKQVRTSRVAAKCEERIDAGMWSGLML